MEKLINHASKLVLPLLIMLATVTSPYANDSLKVMLYGDSLMAGYGLTQSDNLATVLRYKFASSDIAVSIINASVSGNTTSNGLSRVEWSMGDRPDIVVLCLGANDMLRGIDPNNTKDNLESIIATIKQSGAQVILAGMRSPDSMGSTYQHKFDQIYPHLADKHGLVFMPFLLEGVALNKDHLLDDNKHPNAAGVIIIADNLYPYILQNIKNN